MSTVLGIAVAVVLAAASTAATLTYRMRRRDARALAQRGIQALPTSERRVLGEPKKYTSAPTERRRRRLHPGQAQ